jgi:hypothetical protein
MVSLAVHPWRTAGTSYGEGWGRQLVTAQVWRWLSGQADWGRADLLAAPTGQAFWPVDPVLQLLSAPLAALTDTPTALLAALWLLLSTAGLGPTLLAVRLGARWWAAPLAGLLVQLSPFVVDHAADVVLEVLAFGPLAWVAASLHAAWERPSRRALLGVGVSTAVLAGISPYFAIYAALGAACAVAWRPPSGLIKIAGAGALGCLLALAPLLATEGGPGGRLTAGSGDAGYALIPGDMLRFEEGRPVPVERRDLPRLQDHRRPAPWSPPREHLPGGTALALAGLLGLGSRRARPWVGLGLLAVVLGPGPGLLARSLGWRAVPLEGVLGRLLELTPLGPVLGNPVRLLTPWVLLAAVGGAVALRGRVRLALGLVALLLALRAGLPRLPLAAAWRPGPLPPAELVPAGALSIYPSGDPPWWHPAVGPKETLYIAAQLGTPTTGDYGRRHLPADRELLLAAAMASGGILARDALRGGLPPQEPPWTGSAGLLVLEDRLAAAEREQLTAWLEQRAERRWKGSRISLWVPRTPPPVPEAAP